MIYYRIDMTFTITSRELFHQMSDFMELRETTEQRYNYNLKTFVNFRSKTCIVPNQSLLEDTQVPVLVSNKLGKKMTVQFYNYLSILKLLNLLPGLSNNWG